MSQAENAAQTFTLESAAEEIENRMTAAEQLEEVKEEENETQEEIEETEEIETDSDEPDEGSTESDDPEEPETESEDTFETLTDFADALEMPMEEFLASIKTTVKINGEEQEVNLSDLKNGYQMEADYRRKTTELAEQRKAFEQERTQLSEQLQTSLAQASSYFANAEQQLEEEYSKVPWDELKAEESGKYADVRQEFIDRAQVLQAQKAQAQQQANQLIQQQQIDYQNNLRETIAKEQSLLMDSIPEWNNEETRAAEQTQLGNYLLEQGFNKNEIYMQMDDDGTITNPGIIDHRVIGIIRDAMLYRNQSAKVEDTKSKLVKKKLPKVIKSGAKQDKTNIAANKRSELTKKFKKTRSGDDLVAALIERM